jgi:hypothetical protein
VVTVDEGRNDEPVKGRLDGVRAARGRMQVVRKEGTDLLR